MEVTDSTHEVDYLLQVAERLLVFQRSGQFCDTALIGRDRKLIYAHSVVLAIFCQNLTSSLNQRPFFNPAHNVIDLTNFSAEVIEELIECLYTGHFKKNQSTETKELVSYLGIVLSTCNDSEGLALLATSSSVVKEENQESDDKHRERQSHNMEMDLLSNCSENDFLDFASTRISTQKSNTNIKTSDECQTSMQPAVEIQLCDTRPYVCSECSHFFRSPISLKRHIHSVHMEYTNVKPFQCKICDKLCTSYDMLKKHRDSHLWHIDQLDASLNLRCGYCRKVFKYKQSLDSHLRMHEMSDPKMSTGVVDDRFHILVPKRKPPLKNHMCPYCDKAFRGPSRLQIHINRHTGSLPHTCKTCGKGFTTAAYVKKHELIHTGDRGHQCTLCDKSFFSQSTLLCHMNIHMGVKPYPCEICGRGFSQVSSLVKHRKSHSEKSGPGHLCQLCGKHFALWASYSDHIRKHTGEKPFACDDCGKRFIRLYDLQIHQYEHSQLFPYECSECGRGFGNSSKLKRHMLSLHTPNDEKPFRCSHCPRGFAENYLLKQHEQTHFAVVS